MRNTAADHRLAPRSTRAITAARGAVSTVAVAGSIGLRASGWLQAPSTASTVWSSMAVKRRGRGTRPSTSKRTGALSLVKRSFRRSLPRNPARQ